MCLTSRTSSNPQPWKKWLFPPMLHILVITPDWFSRSLVMCMDQPNGIRKWIRLGGFSKLILLPSPSPFSYCICHFSHSPFPCLLPLPFSLPFLSYIRAGCFLLYSPYTYNNWTGLPVLRDFSSLLDSTVEVLVPLFVKHNETAVQTRFLHLNLVWTTTFSIKWSWYAAFSLYSPSKLELPQPI